MPSSLQYLNYASESDIWAVIQVPKIAPDVEISNNTSGTNSIGTTSSVTVVRAPNNSLLPPPGYAVDVYDLFIDYPIDSEGGYPDCEIRFQIGERDVATLTISGGYYRNMFPKHDRIYGGPKAVVPLARSMRSLYNWMLKGTPVKNLPLQITGLKIPSQQPLRVIFKSSQGWGQNGTAIRSLTLYLKGDMWSDGELANFQHLYNGSFAVRRHPNGEVVGQHVLPVDLSAKTMDILPGGTNQTHTTQIYRKIAYATNNLAITTASHYAFTNRSAAGGQENNVTDSRHDLGFVYKDSPNTFIPYEFGLNFAESVVGQGSNPQLYVGWWNAEARTMLPDMYTQGLLISAQRNPFQYGATIPQISDNNAMFPLPNASKLISLLIQNADWAPAVSAVGLGNGYAAGDVTCMVGGIEVVGK